MDEAYLAELADRARALADALMPPCLHGPRGQEEWQAIETTLEHGLIPGGFNWGLDTAGPTAHTLAATARVARRLREDGT